MRVPASTDCRCSNSTVLAATPLAPRRHSTEWTYGAHRARNLASLDALEGGMPSAQRQFVFAHILAPHPPFTFTPDGGFHRPDWPFSIIDGSEYLGSRDEYVQSARSGGVRGEARGEHCPRDSGHRPGPRPVIVIHGDHGPGSRLQSTDAARTDMTERCRPSSRRTVSWTGPIWSTDSITPRESARALSNQLFPALDSYRVCPKPHVLLHHGSSLRLLEGVA